MKGSTLPTAYATIYGSRLVFVQDHLAVFHPERPGIAGDLLVNALAQFVVEWGLVQSRQLTLKLHAEHRCDSLAGGRGGLERLPTSISSSFLVGFNYRTPHSGDLVVAPRGSLRFQPRAIAKSRPHASRLLNNHCSNHDARYNDFAR